MNSMKVKNLTGISKMADFFFPCSFLESECFDLDFAEKK